MKFGLATLNQVVGAHLPPLSNPSPSYTVKDIMEQASRIKPSNIDSDGSDIGDEEGGYEGVAKKQESDHTRPQILAMVEFLTKLNGNVIKKHTFTSCANAIDFVSIVVFYSLQERENTHSVACSCKPALSQE